MFNKKIIYDIIKWLNIRLFKKGVYRMDSQFRIVVAGCRNFTDYEKVKKD